MKWNQSLNIPLVSPTVVEPINSPNVSVNSRVVVTTLAKGQRGNDSISSLRYTRSLTLIVLLLFSQRVRAWSD